MGNERPSYVQRLVTSDRAPRTLGGFKFYKVAANKPILFPFKVYISIVGTNQRVKIGYPCWILQFRGVRSEVTRRYIIPSMAVIGSMIRFFSRGVICQSVTIKKGLVTPCESRRPDVLLSEKDARYHYGNPLLVACTHTSS